MMSRLWKPAVFWVVLFTSVAAAQEEQDPQVGQEAGQEAGQEGEKVQPSGTFYWIRSDSPLVGQRFARNQLNALPRYAEHAPWLDTEEETVEVDERTTRRTLKIYRQNPQGKRELAEVVEEERKTGDGGSVTAVRTVSATDANGKLQLNRRETQETVPSGPDAFRTQTTVELQGPNQELRVVERLEQTERQVDEQTARLERTRSVLDANGNWELAESREASMSDVSGVIQTEERIFRPDGMRRMTLSEEQVGTEWLHDDGVLYRSTETRRPNLQGNMEVVQRVAAMRRDLAEGGQQTVEEVSTRALGVPNSELKLIERVTQETSQADGAKTVWVEGLDMTGRLTAVSSFTTSTKEAPGGKKTSRTVSND